MSKYQERIDDIRYYVSSQPYSSDKSYIKDCVEVIQELVNKNEQLAAHLKANSVHYSNGHYTVRDELWISDELIDERNDETRKE